MLSEQTAKLLNEQINKEFYSAYFYLEIACYYEEKNLSGFANWFNIQAQEERDHALLFLRYLQNNSEKIVLTPIAAAETSYTDFAQPLEATYNHELTVTASINNIYSSALADKDFRTTQFLDWFIKEQGEEEKNTDGLVQKFALFGNDPKGLYLLDQELAARVYTAPSLVLD